jgi:hypothetical protein
MTRGQASEFDGGAPSSWNSTSSCGFVSVTLSSSASEPHDATTVPRRIGPCASWVEKIDAPAWFSQEAQNR